ncbi:MAG TPA: tryptophan synthase subunit alpha [Burkholderiales bacterium]|nr:tryptophan synthase subunit alpha [Burkholderiales bacterium]
MSRISGVFALLRAQKRCALIPYITAGDPDPELTVPLMHALVDAGADIIELGVPFSDPMADGPIIQRAGERALAQGVGLRHVLQMVQAFRKNDKTTPVVLMGYANPIEALGIEAFASLASDAGVDGVITVDYPPEEAGQFIQAVKRVGIDPVFLLSPTTPSERCNLILKQASGFIYYVSLRGVTGASNFDIEDVKTQIGIIRSRTELPVGVGFGIRDPEAAAEVAVFADAVIIGSRLVAEVEAAGKDSVRRLAELLRKFRQAVDAVTRQV